MTRRRRGRIYGGGNCCLNLAFCYLKSPSIPLLLRGRNRPSLSKGGTGGFALVPVVMSFVVVAVLAAARLDETLDLFGYLKRVVQGRDKLHIRGREHPLFKLIASHPVQKAAPEFLIHHDYGERLYLHRLDERESLEALVHRPETAGEDYERG